MYQNPNQQMIEEKSNQQMIDSKTHQHMKCDIKGIKSTQQMIDKTPIENKIPIKTKTSTRRKDTKKKIILDRNQVK